MLCHITHDNLTNRGALFTRMSMCKVEWGVLEMLVNNFVTECLSSQPLVSSWLAIHTCLFKPWTDCFVRCKWFARESRNGNRIAYRNPEKVNELISLNTVVLSDYLNLIDDEQILNSRNNFGNRILLLKCCKQKVF